MSTMAASAGGCRHQRAPGRSAIRPASRRWRARAPGPDRRGWWRQCCGASVAAGERRDRRRPDCACAAWSRSRRVRPRPARTLPAPRSASAATTSRAILPQVPARIASARRFRRGGRGGRATARRAAAGRVHCASCSDDLEAAVAERGQRAGGAAELQRQRFVAQPAAAGRASAPAPPHSRRASGRTASAAHAAARCGRPTAVLRWRSASDREAGDGACRDRPVSASMAGAQVEHRARCR